MRVLVVLSSKTEREAIAQLLRGRRHDVDQATDFASAVTLLEKYAFDSVLVEWALPNQAAHSLLKKMKGMASTAPAHVVVVLEPNQAVEPTLLFADGAHDFMRKPYWKAELLARVEVPNRLRGQNSAYRPRDIASKRDSVLLPGWGDMGAIVARDLAGMTGCEFESVKDPTGFSAMDFAARLGFVSAARAMEVHVLVGVGAASMGMLANSIVGVAAPSNDVIEDLLREIANTTAGGLKRAAPAEEDLTTGLPQNVPVSEFRTALKRSFTRFICKVKGRPIELAFVVEKVVSTTLRIPASRLVEGMVLITDLRTESGLLLISGGTRLTSSAADRVARMLGTQFQVEVARAA